MSRARRFRPSDVEVLAFLRERRIAKAFTPEDLARMHPRRFDNGPHRTALCWARDRIKLLRKHGFNTDEALMHHTRAFNEKVGAMTCGPCTPPSFEGGGAKNSTSTAESAQPSGLKS